MKNLRTRLLTIVTGIALLLGCKAFASDKYQSLSQDEFLSLDKSAFLIVDVRTPEEYASGHVPGAVNIPLADIKQDISMFNDKSQPIVMYCRSGKRAGTALHILAGNGFTKLHHLDGDMLGWEKNNRPIEKP